jgi:muramoyltetrapeptide carboxypeptidase
MIHNAYVKAIISLRGGYGTSKILDLIDLKSLKESKKWVIGFSDITALHLALNNIGICSLHATMPTNFNSTHVISLESLKNSLFGVLNKYEVEINSLNVLGKVRGEIVGGNLSLIYSLNSTKYEINCNNKILFIEDLNEQLYHLDRMMLNLKLSGKLAKIKGLVVGGMSNMKDSETNFGKTAYEIIYDYVKEYKYPVLFNFPAGHIEKNFALVIGSEVVLTVNKSNSLLEFV